MKRITLVISIAVYVLLVSFTAVAEEITLSTIMPSQATNNSPEPSVYATQQVTGNGDAGILDPNKNPNLRKFNTLVINNIGASLDSGKITLPPGTYYIEWSAPAMMIQSHATCLHNYTAGTITWGTTEWSAMGASYAQTRSQGACHLDSSTNVVIGVEHYVTVYGAYGQGIGSGEGSGAPTWPSVSIYAWIKIWKLST